MATGLCIPRKVCPSPKRYKLSSIVSTSVMYAPIVTLPETYLCVGVNMGLYMLEVFGLQMTKTGLDLVYIRRSGALSREAPVAGSAGRLPV